MTEKQHLAQARHNEVLFAQLDLAQFPDWGATLLFYSALHHLDAALRRLGLPQPLNHHHRKQALFQCSLVPAAVRTAYLRLERHSQQARYEDWASQGIDEAFVRQLRRTGLSPLIRALRAVT